MGLGIPQAQVQHVALAVGARPIGIGIGARGGAEGLAPALAAAQTKRRVDGVAGLVTQQAQAPAPRTALHLEHHLALQPHESRVGQVEGDGDSRHLVGREPLLGEPVVGAKPEAPGRELVVEGVDPLQERSALNRQAEIAEPHVQQLVLGELRPSGVPRPGSGTAPVAPARPLFVGGHTDPGGPP